MIKMNLFLCGGGSGLQVLYAMDMFANLINKKKPVLYIPLAMKNEKYNSCYEWFKDEMKQVNITNFEMITTSIELSKKDFNDYSAIFIGGGNTYKLLYELKANNNINKIKEYLKNNGIVFGGSAGAIIFGKDVNGCALEDDNDVKLNDTKGLNFIDNYSLLCHLNDKNLNKNLEYLKKYSLENKLIYLPEDNVIHVTENEFNILGDSDYIMFENGSYINFTH